MLTILSFQILFSPQGQHCKKKKDYQIFKLHPQNIACQISEWGSYIPWIVVNAENTFHRYSMDHICKRAAVQLLAAQRWKRSSIFSLSSSSDSQPQFSILTPAMDTK